MSLRETVRIIQPGQRRVKIFVDFWNLVINARKQAKFEIDFHWDKLADRLVGSTHGGYGDESSGSLAGCYIFGSYSKSDPRQYAFVNRTLDKYGSLPGLFFDFNERVKKETSSKCSNCGEQVSRSSESGVDVLLTVEMIKHASMREHDYLALVSSDRDFLPLLSFLKDQGQRVLHVSTGTAQREMRSLTWMQVELMSEYPSLCSIANDRHLILTSPLNAARLQEAKSVLDKNGLEYDVLDITKVEEINDKDLVFLAQNQSMFFRNSSGDSSHSYSINRVAETLHEFRKSVSDGRVHGDLPYVMRNGEMEVYFAERQGGWVRNGRFDSDIWRSLQSS